jgi:hypothetical protein
MRLLPQVLVFAVCLPGCDRVFGIYVIPAPDANWVSDSVAADQDAGFPKDASIDAAPLDVLVTGCDVVAQTGCPGTEACYPQAGPDYCASPGAAVDGASCQTDNDCARGYFCGDGVGICYRICDCGAAPGTTCNQPTSCSSTATHQCRQYTNDFGYCEL